MARKFNFMCVVFFCFIYYSMLFCVRTTNINLPRGYKQSEERSDWGMLLIFGLVIFFGCDFQMLRMLEISNQKIICWPSISVSTYGCYKWELSDLGFSFNTWRVQQFEEALKFTYCSYCIVIVTKVVLSSLKNFMLKIIYNFIIILYWNKMDFNFQTEPNLYVPKTTSYVRTFFVPGLTSIREKIEKAIFNQKKAVAEIFLKMLKF